MKKIVILTDQISDIGGITSLIHLKANYWAAKQDREITIITTEQKSKPPFYNLSDQVKLIDLGIDYDRHSSYFGKKNFFKVLKNYQLLQKVFFRIKPTHVIIANHIPVTLFFPFLITKAKFIKEFHFTQYNINKRKVSLFRKLEAFIESRLDSVVVLSKEEKSFYKHKNIAVIPNPVIFDIQKTPFNQERRKVAIAAGRISEVKRFDVLIDIWGRFSELDNKWKLEIYGDGEEEYLHFLNKKIKDLGLGERIEIKGATSTLKEKMLNSSLYLMTSEEECFPMVLLEAQSYGLTIIAFDCNTGPRNIIKNKENGVLVEMNNKEEFVKELVALTQQDLARRELAEAGFENAKRFTLEKIMTIWEEKVINR